MVALPPSDALPAALDVELPESAEPAPAVLGSLAVVDGGELVSLTAWVDPAAGGEADGVSELASAGGAASAAGDPAADDVAGLEGSGAGAAGVVVVVVPPPEAVGAVGVEPVGSPEVGAGDVPASPVGPGAAAGVDPPLVVGLEPDDVGVEVAPLDVVVVVDGADGVVPADVEVAVPGAGSGAPDAPAGGLAARRDGRADTEATSLSRVVGGAAAR